MIRNILFVVIAFILVSCAKEVDTLRQRKIIYLPELKQQGVLTPQQIENNRNILKEHREKQKLLLQIAKLDKKERKKLEKKQEKITKKEKQLTELITEESTGKKSNLSEIREIVTSSKEIKSLAKILKEKTDMSEENIQKVVKLKAQLMREKKQLRLEALTKIHARLLRNRKLKIGSAFCAKTSPIDQFVITPVKYPLDVHTVDKKSVNVLFQTS